MNLDTIKTGLKEIFAERLNLDVAGIDAGDDDKLFSDDGWGLDSVDVIDIVLGVEQKFGVAIRADDDVKVHFSTLNTLAAYIDEQMKAAA